MTIFAKLKTGKSLMKTQNLFHLMKLIIGLARDLHFAKSFQFGVRR